MPLYEYACGGCGAKVEEPRPVDRRNEIGPLCPSCGLDTERVSSVPHFQLSWNPVPHDRAKDIWAGTPLEDDDGINPLPYKSKRRQVDLGSS